MGSLIVILFWYADTAHTYRHTKKWIIQYCSQESLFNGTKIRVFSCINAGHTGHAVYGMKGLCTLKHWDRGFKSHLKHGYLSAFILCLC
jgi:hypothetical protein